MSQIYLSMMNGQTAAAILEQCEKLETEVNGLINQLNDSINYITKTVQKYKEEDELIAKKIIEQGGV